MHILLELECTVVTIVFPREPGDRSSKYQWGDQHTDLPARSLLISASSRTCCFECEPSKWSQSSRYLSPEAHDHSAGYISGRMGSMADNRNRSIFYSGQQYTDLYI